MNVDNILNWLSNVVKTMPDGIIQSLILGIVILILKKILAKLPIIGLRFSEWSTKLSNFFNNNTLEISDDTKIILTPTYNPGVDFKVKRKRRKQSPSSKNMSDDDFWGIIILSIFIIAGIVSIFVQYKNEISLALKWYGLIPLVFSIIILFIVAISGRIQKSTLIYLIYSIPISMLTIYYGVNLLKLSEGMSATFTNGELAKSMYKITGILIAVTQQFVAYFMIFRNLLIHVARKMNVPGFVKRIIYNTTYLESQIPLIITIIIFSVISYVMSSGILISWIQN